MESGLWQGILARYGQTVTLVRGEEEIPVRAFFQPVEEKHAGETPTALGVAPAGKWLYLGPAEESLEEVEQLTWEGRRFSLLRHRDYLVGDDIFYRWAVCREMDGEREA